LIAGDDEKIRQKWTVVTFVICASSFWVSLLLHHRYCVPQGVFSIHQLKISMLSKENKNTLYPPKSEIIPPELGFWSKRATERILAEWGSFCHSDDPFCAIKRMC